MKSIVLLSIFFGACFAVPPRAIRGDCLEHCPQVYSPICGSDGTEFRSFPNGCQMKVFNCMKSRDFHPLRAGLCDEGETSGFGLLKAAVADSKPAQGEYNVVRRKIELPSPPRGNCPEICTYIYAPICGSDGHEFRTFSNQCVLDSFNCFESRNFLPLRFGQCEDGFLGVGGVEKLPEKKVAVERKRCKPCTRIYLPVCGFDGQEQRVFSNQCDMIYTNCMESRSFALLKDGEC